MQENGDYIPLYIILHPANHLTFHSFVDKTPAMNELVAYITRTNTFAMSDGDQVILTALLKKDFYDECRQNLSTGRKMIIDNDSSLCTLLDRLMLDNEETASGD